MPASDNLTKNLLKNASWLFSGGLATSVFASLETIILARFLGIEQFGVFSLIVAYVGIVNGIVDFKSSEAGIRYIGEAREREEGDRVLSFIKFFYVFDFLVGAAALAACILFAGAANEFFIRSDGSFELILIYSASLLVSSVNRTSEAILRVFERFRTVAVVRVLRTALRTGLVYACLSLGFGMEGVFVSYVIASFVFFVMLQASVLRALRREGLRSWITARTENVAAIISETRSFILSSTFVWFLKNAFSRQLPVLVLGHFSGHEAAGLYKVATVISSAIMKLRDPLDQATYPPLVTAASRGDLGEFVRIVSRSIKSALKFFLPTGAVFLLFASEIILIFFGAEYQPAATAMRIMVVSEVLSAFYFWIDGAELALDRLKRRMFRVTVCSAAYLGALIALVPPYSYDGAAAATLFPSVLALREIRAKR